MHKVDFFIIGAQKAGTTSVYQYLAEHPDIFMPKVKENHFFCEDRFYSKGENYFHKYYDDYKNQKIIGGAYVHMFSSVEAPERVFKYNKNAKILIMLRNPVDRAYSAYHFALQNGWESPQVSFLDSLKLQQERICGNFTEKTDLSYFYVGLYYTHISNWLKWFPKESLYIMFDNDLRNKPLESMQSLFKYLGVSESVDINTDVVHNKSRSVKYKGIHYFIRNKESSFKKAIAAILPFRLKYLIRTKVRKSIDKLNITEKKYTPLSVEDRRIVLNYFEKDLKSLTKLYNVDFKKKWNI